MRIHIKNLALPVLFGLSSVGCTCFTAGTRIDTPEGPRPIEGLMKGEKVWAWDLKEEVRVVRRIQVIHRNLAQTLCRIEVGESLISGVTPEHPFFRADTREFVALRDLPTNAHLLRLVDGEPREARLSTLKITEHPKPCVSVFNLAVEGPEHNYFAESVLVHNKPPIPPDYATYYDTYSSADWHTSPDADATGTDFDTISPPDAMPDADTAEATD